MSSLLPPSGEIITTTPFNDRSDAGKQLAISLEKYKTNNPLVLAIPRGGVEIGYEIASFLNSAFSIVITRKLPLPYNPEAGFGAIAEDGSTYIVDDIVHGIPEEEINRIVTKQIREIKRRKKVLRNAKPLPRISHKTIILTDDGIAMGSTMKATISMIKKKNPKKIIVAVPVAGPRVAQEMDTLVDETVILTIPHHFHAVAQVYKRWYVVDDKEVLSIMKKVNNVL